MRFAVRMSIQCNAIRKEIRAPGRTRAWKNIVHYPGEDAPGTGRRHVPLKEEHQRETRGVKSIDKHHLVTTEDYYAAFPSLVHTSCPLEITDTGMDG